jgi:hypothetical protein
LQHFRARRKDHHGDFIFPLQVPKGCQGGSRQGLERGVHRLGHVEEQHHGKGQLIAAAIADRLWDAIFRELKVFRRQRIHRYVLIFLFSTTASSRTNWVSTWMVARADCRGRCRRLRPAHLPQQQTQ